MKTNVLIILGIIFVSGFVGTAYAAENHVDIPSPREQLEDGITSEKITCKIGHVLALRTNGMPACVQHNTADRLGWETIKTQFDYSAYKEEGEKQQQPSIDKNETSGMQQHRQAITTISNPEPESDDKFGSSVAIGNGILAVGVPRDDHDNSNNDDIIRDTGSVYLYELSSLNLIHTMRNPEPEFRDYFGISLAIGNGILAVGADGDDLHEQHISSINQNVGSIQWLQAVNSVGGTGTIRVTDPDMNLESTAVDYFDVEVRSDSDAMSVTVTETNKTSGVFEGTVLFSPDDESAVGRLVVTQDDTVTAVYKDNTLPYPYTSIEDLDVVTVSTIVSLDGSSSANADVASPDPNNLGSIQWLQRAYSQSGTGVVRVVDADMNTDSERIENYDVKVWSDTDSNGINLTVTETGDSSGVFEGTVFFTTQYESGHRLVVSEGDAVTAVYKDSTLPYPYTSIEDLDVVTVSMIGPVDDSSHVGSVYLYDIKSGENTHVIHHPEPGSGANFGSGVDINDNVLTIKTSDTGSVYAFDVKSGELLHVIDNPKHDHKDRFGSYVAMDDNVLAVGVSHNDDNAGNVNSVYLYDTKSGELLHVIDNPGQSEDYRFGRYVGVGDGIFAISVMPQNYTDDVHPVYLYDVKSGERIRIMHNPESSYRDQYVPLVIHDGIFAIGMPGNNPSGNDRMDFSGSVYLHDVTSRNPALEIHNPEPERHDRFGSSIAMDEGFLAIGVPGDNNDDDKNTIYSVGSAYLYDMTLLHTADLSSTNNANDSSQEKRKPIELQNVLDSCNSTAMQQPAIRYGYSNNTHIITNSSCEWQTIEEYEKRK